MIRFILCKKKIITTEKMRLLYPEEIKSEGFSYGEYCNVECEVENLEAILSGRDGVEIVGIEIVKNIPVNLSESPADNPENKMKPSGKPLLAAVALLREFMLIYENATQENDDTGSTSLMAQFDKVYEKTLEFIRVFEK